MGSTFSHFCALDLVLAAESDLRLPGLRASAGYDDGMVKPSTLEVEWDLVSTPPNPGSPSASTAAWWRSRRLTFVIPVGLLAVMQAVNVGLRTGSWLIFVALPAAGLLIGVTATWWYRRRDAKSLAEAPPDTLFTARGNLRDNELRFNPRFQSMVQNWRSSWRTMGLLSVRVTLTDKTISVVPSRRAKGAEPLTIPWSWVQSVEAVKLPAAFNTAGLDVTLLDGSTLHVELFGYDRLSKTVATLSVPARAGGSTAGYKPDGQS